MDPSGLYTPEDASLVLAYSGYKDLNDFDSKMNHIVDTYSKSIVFEKWLKFILSKLRKGLFIRCLQERQGKQISLSNYPSLSIPATATDHHSLFLGANPDVDVSHPLKKSQLPPLRVRPTKFKVACRKEMNEAGYDDMLGRETPRCLRGGESKLSSVQELRKELRLANEGLAQLGTLVNKNIAWVQSNCDGMSSKKTISQPARDKCRDIAIHRMTEVVDGFHVSTKLWALLRWRSVALHHRLALIAESFSKAKGADIILSILSSALRRRLLTTLTRWSRSHKQAVRRERAAAVIQIQRIVRGHQGKLRVRKLLKAQAAKNERRRLELLHEATRARAEFEEKKRLIAAERAKEAADRAEKDIRTIQAFYQGKLAVKSAKLELDALRRNAAAKKVQKLQIKHKERLLQRRREETSVKVMKEFVAIVTQYFISSALLNRLRVLCPVSSTLVSAATPSGKAVCTRPDSTGSFKDKPVDANVLKGVVSVQCLFRRIKVKEKELTRRTRSKLHSQKTSPPVLEVVVGKEESAALIRIQSIVRGRQARATKVSLSEEKENARKRLLGLSEPLARKKSLAAERKMSSPGKAKPSPPKSKDVFHSSPSKPKTPEKSQHRRRRKSIISSDISLKESHRSLATTAREVVSIVISEIILILESEVSDFHPLKGSVCFQIFFNKC